MERHMSVEVGRAPEHVNAWLYERLVEAARNRQLLSYSDLGPTLHLDFDNPNDRRRVGELLGEISRFEHSQGRPMLSSIVWHKDFSGPGHGLYNLGVELGVVWGTEDELAFASRQARETHDFWSAHR
jgi:hypothetical protein